MIGRTPTLLAACLLLAGLSAPSTANAAGEANIPMLSTGALEARSVPMTEARYAAVFRL